MSFFLWEYLLWRITELCLQTCQILSNYYEEYCAEHENEGVNSISVSNRVSLYYVQFRALFVINLHSSEIYVHCKNRCHFAYFNLLVLGISNTISINGKHGLSLWQTWRVVNLANSCLPSSFPQIQSGEN